MAITNLPTDAATIVNWLQSLAADNAFGATSGSNVPTAPGSETPSSNQTFLQGIGYKQNLLQININSFFNRKTLNAQYVTNFTANDPTGGQPYTFLSEEIDFYYSLNKNTIARYKPRLMHYRDDMSSKGARIPSSINFGVSHYTDVQDKANNNQI